MVELFPRRGLDKLFHRRVSELFHWRGLSFSTGGGLSSFKGVIGRPDQKSVINQWVRVNPLE